MARDRLLSPGTCSLRCMNGGAVVVDAAVRFARSNPELVAYARVAAAATGRSVDDLLLDAIERLRDASAPQRRYRRSSAAAARRTETSA